jgi:multiple sugar transport system permease protein
MRARQTFLFLSPWLLTLAAFYLFPVVYSLVLSLLNFNPLNPSATTWAGLANYVKAFRDPVLGKAAVNTLYFVVGTVPVTTVLALVLAILLNRSLPGQTFFRAGFFVPTLVSMVVISLVFKELYAQDGILNQALSLLGIQGKAWLLDERTALPGIMLMDVWSAIGYYMLLFLAGLQAIPRDLYEAASIDGSSKLSQVFQITLPHLRPVALVVIVVNTIRSFQVFIEVFVMTRGGPLNSTLTVVYDLYERAFYRFEMGYASAIAYLLFAIIFLVSLIQARFLRLGQPVGG